MATTRDSVMHAHEVPDLVHRLVALTGQGRIKNAVASWRNSIRSSRGLVKQYFKDNSFRWWPAFDDFWSTERRGSTSYSNNVLALAKDARKIFDLLPDMPSSAQRKFANALSSRENAPAHVFEISIAWHFWKQGFPLTWFEESTDPIPEFVVKTPKFEFEVECKQIGVDSTRAISRLDFCKLGQAVVDAVRRHRVMGHIDLTLNKPLSGNHSFIQGVSRDVAAAVCGRGGRDYDWGHIELTVTRADDVPIDFAVHHERMRSNLTHGSHAAIVAQPPDKPTNPLVFSCKTLEPDAYLRGIQETLKEAARRQLTGLRAGFLCVYIPEIHSFEGLQQDSGISGMTHALYGSEDRAHIAAVAYSSEDREAAGAHGLEFYTQALVFKNPRCRFAEPAQFRFLEEWRERG